jgi:hypothetical protein
LDGFLGAWICPCVRAGAHGGCGSGSSLTASSDDDYDADDDYDDFITGVDTDNPDHPDNSYPDAEEADEKNNDSLSASQDEDDVVDDVSLSEENMNEDAPTRLKKLTDDTGTFPPMIQSKTRQQAKETGESLMTVAESIKTVKKKQRKFRKELQIRLFKREEEENKKKLRNKLRNEEKNKNQERKGKSTQLGRTSASGNR